MYMMQTFFRKRHFFGVSYAEIAVLFGVYFFFAFGYYLTLEINRAYGDRELQLTFSGFKNQGIDYLLKLLLTIPIWLFIFRVLKHLKLYQRLLLHIITLPIFVYGWQQLYYYLSEYFNYYHLVGSGEVWDLYIPALFYILQFGIFHAYEYYTENEKKQKLESELREAALKSELSALKAQINPHFLYNVFNTINASVPKEQEKTRMLIAELSDLFRYQLKASQVETVTVEEELDFVKKYLSLEKERFEERLTVSIEVDEALLTRPVPPMILQPLAENCIKHGLASLIEGGSVSIKIVEIEKRLHFEVADNGVGVKNVSGLFDKGIGLTNTNLRLEKMYGSALKIENNLPRGLKVSFSI